MQDLHELRGHDGLRLMPARSEAQRRYLNMRRCLACGEEKPIEAFHKQRQGRDGRRARCNTCVTEEARRWRYGGTLAEAIVLQGSSMCAICGVREACCVDHDHETKKIRGALCRKCNIGLHYVESPAWVQSARAYLEASDASAV